MRLRTRSFIPAVLLAASTIACDGRTSGFLTTPSTGGLRVRLLNALTSAPSLSFVVDAQVASSGVPFGGASPYVPLTLGSHRLQVQAATGSTLLDFTRDLTAAGSFSLIPAPGLAQLGALFIPDDPTTVPGQAKLRAIHVAAASVPVSVYVTSPTSDLASATPVVSVLAFGAASPYVTVAPGTYRIRLTPAGAPGTVLLDSGSITVGGGSVRTLLLTDAPGGGPPTTLSIVPDVN
jgi:hypothetical protein